MDINDYQRDALSTTKKDSDTKLKMIEGVMGLNGEAGECVDIVKKYLFQGHKLDKKHLAEELGDVAWYINLTAHSIGYDLEDILLMNMDKRSERYPNGFKKENSINRKEK